MVTTEDIDKREGVAQHAKEATENKEEGDQEQFVLHQPREVAP